MTIKEKLESIKGKKIAILVENEDEDYDLVKILNLITHERCEGFWDGYKICYSLDEIYDTEMWNYGNIECYDEHEIIKYADFIKEVEDLGYIEITQQDINAILNEKYGEDNWVILE